MGLSFVEIRPLQSKSKGNVLLKASTSDKLELARAITMFKEEEIRHLAEPDDVDFVLTLDVIHVGSLIDLLFLSTLRENGK